MRRSAIAFGILLTFWAAGAIFLHLGQVRHNTLELPEIPEPKPGERFAATLGALLEHELDSVTGWRPNDLFFWSPTLFADNNSNRQLGILLAIRETARVFKDHLTKVSSDEYDPNLQKADTLFRNDAERTWFPSAEGRFREGTDELHDYVAGLHSTPQRSRLLNQRNVELIRLFQTWTDLLGDAHAALYREDLGFFDTDDAFYHSQGAAHVMAHAVRAVRSEYAPSLEGRPILATLFEEVTEALDLASTLKPFIILDGGPASLFANHRRNLDGYVTEARQKMYSIREELEK